MPLKRKVYDVHLNPDGYDPATADPFDVSDITTHRVVVTHADQMRGELEAGKRGIPDSAGQNLTSVILWCALTRTGVYAGKYDQFRNADCAGMEYVDPDESGEPAEVPPTAEPSGSASSSLSTSLEPLTGSTPTSTSD